MGFFDRFQTEAVPEAEEQDAEVPDFGGQLTAAPHLGGVWGPERVMARNERAAIVLRDLVAFPDGFGLEISAWIRKPTRVGRRSLFMHPFDMDPGPLPPTFLRFGIERGDGRADVNFGPHLTDWGPDAAAADTGMEWTGGGGSNAQMTFHAWIWPLPSESELTLVCEWPIYEIPETRLVLDAELIRAAAARAEPVWPDVIGPSHITRSLMIRLSQEQRRQAVEALGKK